MGRRFDHVILDRDGVLNVEAAGGWVLCAEEWRWQAGALLGLRLLGDGGRTLSVATNQSCVGRGLADDAAIEAVHERMRAEASAAGAPLAQVFVCPHAPEDRCSCRKPAPGLLLLAIEASGVPADRTLFVGDSATDLQAAARAGMTPVLLRTGKGRATEASCGATGVAVFDDLPALAESLNRGELLAGQAGREPSGEVER